MITRHEEAKEFLKEIGGILLQSIPGAEPMVTMDRYSSILDGRREFTPPPVFEIRHRMCPGHDDSYVIILPQHEVRILQRSLQELEILRTWTKEADEIRQREKVESKVRLSNKTVQEAYQQYKLLLELSK